MAFLTCRPRWAALAVGRFAFLQVGGLLNSLLAGSMKPSGVGVPLRARSLGGRHGRAPGKPPIEACRAQRTPQLARRLRVAKPADPLN